ncbi:MAG: 30S ribosomal protein S12 methylthiotransferase RimO [Myxococcales bacterium]|nr:30S ribosomal protein S12 methylthiotransferase RimO [Myxococcales bacterium]MCB9521642.1 30S ribosomal protein S12 methylthiotransferase RimO [Myxococcales bacterium]MCB9531600.1 30S ribosomal protein S12 methylthiotransferase RimO [Myxococcales bacterium]MCB9532748.1 30S ribosomal protein S12 methylthiotransferase RimO [Myxococcales bacterium]
MAHGESFSLIDRLAPKRVHVVSLGCPKNRVDSELMLGLMRGDGYEVVDDPERADLLVVNTCAFIESAKQESIDAILDLADYKNQGTAKRLVVTGCMAQRYGAELAAEIPEVDYFLGTNEFKRITRALAGELPERTYITAGSALYTADEDRVNTIRGGSAYLKIAEGCNRSCSFCIIPKIRGPQVSRPLDDLVREARLLAASGVKELALIAQDLTSYGVDLGNRDGLERLLVALEDVDGIEWIRLHYAYPWNFTDRLIDILGSGGKVVPYVDMPLQHISDDILRAMRRNVRRDAQRELIDRLRSVDGMVLRTVFITGFPGETDAQFDELCRWVEEVRFDRVGVFAYSPEENTAAVDLPGAVPQEVAEERRDHLMALQQPISRQKNEALIGETMRVLVDGVSDEHELVLEGRYYGQALGIDGVVYLSFDDGARVVTPGSFVDVEIDDASEYDLLGVVRA